jgi:hypothetical protein
MELQLLLACLMTRSFRLLDLLHCMLLHLPIYNGSVFMVPLPDVPGDTPIAFP